MPRRSARLASKPRLDYATMNSSGKKVAKLSKPVKKAIQKIITARKEKKFATRFSGDVVFNSAITFADFHQLVPQIPQGDDVNQRIGDSIRPSHMMVNVYVRATEALSGDNSFCASARLFILEDRMSSSATLTSATGTVTPDPAVLLDAGGDHNPYTGTPDWHLIPANKERYLVHKDKVIKIERSQGTNTILQPSISVNQHHVLRFRVPLKKVWKYDANDQTLPTNQSIWFALGYCQYNGVPQTDLTNVVATFNATVYYTDE